MKPTISHPPEVAAYYSQKPVTKAEVAKLLPGTLVQLRWKDAPNSLGILLQKMDPGPGEISLHILHLERFGSGLPTSANSLATHEQVVSVVGHLYSELSEPS